jgi:hypothetical protein
MIHINRNTMLVCLVFIIITYFWFEFEAYLFGTWLRDFGCDVLVKLFDQFEVAYQ